jgi:major vault protein
MPEMTQRERDLILGPNEYAMILDETKGNITLYVGPHKTSLSGTDKPVVLNDAGKFIGCDLAAAVKVFATADEGSYIVLKNPSETKPRVGPNITPELQMGRKMNIAGPAMFPLWPGQTAHIIEGHRLHSNQYLLVRVYNDEIAKKSWTTGGVVKPTSDVTSTTSVLSGIDPAKLVMGQLLIIAGTEISFYIPPTGVEVVSVDGTYVRDAVTLERLEYCILLDENGTKRFVQGPAVVFPKPTETFIQYKGSTKMRAIELNDNMGLYIKVIADYQDEVANKEYKTGDEIFLTGKEQKIYFPRQEHAVIKYGDEELHYAIAIPKGEARYVLNKITGEVVTKHGPLMYLPDPRVEVVVRRVLDPKTVQLWFPGNSEALQINLDLEEKFGSQTDQNSPVSVLYSTSSIQKRLSQVAVAAAGDSFERKTKYTPSRSITLNTKYDGAVAIDVWTGYAIQVIDKSGNRRVVNGPQTVLLEYDETLEVLTMSTGTPKSDNNVIKTVYLLSQNNKVSDAVTAETRDLVNVTVKTSYRVNFEGDNSGKWFSVENYVKLLTDHLRSMVRHMVKQHTIEDFNDNAVSLIRDAILGVAENGKRPGRAFLENNMRVYDVEVLDVVIGDSTIATKLKAAQTRAVEQSLTIKEEEKALEIHKREEQITRSLDEEVAETTMAGLKNEQIVADLKHKIALEVEAARRKESDLVNENNLATESSILKVAKIKAEKDLTVAEANKQISQLEQYAEIQKLEADTKAFTDRASSWAPQLLTVAEMISDKELAGKLTQILAPLAIYGNNTLPGVISQLTQGSALEEILKRVMSANPTKIESIIEKVSTTKKLKE